MRTQPRAGWLRNSIKVMLRDIGNYKNAEPRREAGLRSLQEPLLLLPLGFSEVADTLRLPQNISDFSKPLTYISAWLFLPQLCICFSLSLYLCVPSSCLFHYFFLCSVSMSLSVSVSLSCSLLSWSKLRANISAQWFERLTGIFLRSSQILMHTLSLHL